MNLRQAAEMALEALEKMSPETDILVEVAPHVWEYRGSLVIQALRQALDLQTAIERGTTAWADVPDATKWVDDLRGNTPACPTCKFLERNKQMFAQYMLGDSFTKIAKDYGMSKVRASQIVHSQKRKQHIDLNPWNKQSRDEHIAMFGTWAQKVCLLLPHLKAIKAIAEEKNT
jgi:hypothetical protein